MKLSRSHVMLALGLAVAPACVVPGPTVGPRAPRAAVIVEAPEPPPPRAEPVQPQPGYVFITGRWMWQQGRWIWIAGHWEPARAGYAWNPGRWQRQGRGWIWIEGSWSATPPQSPPQSPPDQPPASTGDPTAVAMLALGEDYTCSLTVAGQIRCWGHNHHGALGVGSRAQHADGLVTGISEPVRAIAAGGHHTCALTTAGNVWCWGSNLEGQIGNGSTAASEQPVLAPVRVAGLRDVSSLHLGDAGVVAEVVYVGGVHVCTVRGGVATCRGNDAAGAVGGAR